MSANTHAELVELASSWLRNTRGCGVVLNERGTPSRADAIGWARLHAPQCVLVECKRTLSDFKADKYKACRRFDNDDWHGLGDERYYFTPRGLLTPEQLPPGWGLLEWDGRVVRMVVKSRQMVGPRPVARMSERNILVKELRIYHAQGIRYLSFDEQKDAAAQQREDREAEIRSIGVYPLEAIA